jgi:hypothetical protein
MADKKGMFSRDTLQTGSPKESEDLLFLLHLCSIKNEFSPL